MKYPEEVWNPLEGTAKFGLEYAPGCAVYYLSDKTSVCLTNFQDGVCCEVVSDEVTDNKYYYGQGLRAHIDLSSLPSVKNDVFKVEIDYFTNEGALQHGCIYLECETEEKARHIMVNSLPKNCKSVANYSIGRITIYRYI